MSKLRQSRTRTLIQLGGLLEKAGLTDALQIEMGQDLQKDTDVFSKIALLMGLLEETLKRLKHATPDEVTHWIQQGRSILKEDA